MTEQDAQNMRSEFAGLSDVIREAYRQGYTDGQDDERSAVVAWLRSRHGYGPVADAIESGEHRREVKP